MKRSFVYSIILFGVIAMPLSLMGQNFANSLPKVGNVQYNCEHFSKVEPFMLTNENKEYWNFNFLFSYWSIKEIYAEAKSSKNHKAFPTATLVLNKVDNEEEFFYIKDGSLLSLGKIIDVTYNNKGREVIHYNPAKRVINTTKKVGQTYTNVHTTWMKFAKNNMKDGYNFIPENHDSMYVEITVNESARVVDELNLIYSDTPKKAQKHEFNVIPVVKVKVKNTKDANWQVYEKSSLQKVPEELKTYIRAQKHLRTDFISPDYKGVLLSYEIQNKNVVNCFYQDMEPSPYMKNVNFDTSDAIASPNPTTGNIAVRLFNHPYDDYTIELYNVVGKKIFSRTFNRNNGRLLKTDISSLKRGTYMYSVLDSKGRKLMTKRISLIGT